MPTVHGASAPLSNAPSRHAAHCSTCALQHYCLPQGLSSEDVNALQKVIVNARTIKRGETLFHVGDTFDTLYAVRSGSLKTVVSAANGNGREQVMGLHLGGDALGLEAFDTGLHACHAVALEDSSVCLIPHVHFERACRETSALQRRLLQLLSREIVRKSTQTLILGTLRADERVAALLLDLSARLKHRGYAGNEFNLRLTRDDMGSFLGITLETVSRTLSRFQAMGLIDANGKLIQILDFDGLRAI
ncbi:helix-turn-helix domain-containing protein [Caballeronia sp. SEWSISQ10-4 2]|uniref:helix-turn-helix domain-containing protein n=1 Tax=Caballeronia sp. SEWSISQ10-4 2 TaxID=2937438 RepID=UPI00264B650B|nr:helix-turn-helix domain-containing protein [Caballeronia sp. SEWSISQ10-4 2]MDN7184643.1 helix-turn-helix domain-containing protein [Caballeronia sp. SEWSISQ10-4 2]